MRLKVVHLLSLVSIMATKKKGVKGEKEIVPALQGRVASIHRVAEKVNIPGNPVSRVAAIDNFVDHGYCNYSSNS